MAGSLNHIVNEDGSFTMDLIENMGDAEEALEECHRIIAALLPYAAEGMGGGDATGALAQIAHELGWRDRPDRRTPIIYAQENP